MAFVPSTVVTVIGSLTRDPKHFPSKGDKSSYTTISVATNEGKKDTEYHTVAYHDVKMWNELADNVAESFSKGDRVVVVGRLHQETEELEKDGEPTRRTIHHIQADAVAADTRFATVTIERQQAASSSKAKPKPKADDTDTDEDEPTSKPARRTPAKKAPAKKAAPASDEDDF